MRRTVLISGGARGIGAAIAKRFEQEGHVVLKPSRAELDLANADSLEAFLLREGSQPIDVLINNAGINILNPIADLDAAAWATMLQVNLKSPVRLTQALLPGMKERQWGRVLNISSIFSLVTKEKRLFHDKGGAECLYALADGGVCPFWHPGEHTLSWLCRQCADSPE
jgi:NAD(P)-dependent dehydrogenase (short-subunit alcohol dehydrogenase family)